MLTELLGYDIRARQLLFRFAALLARMSGRLYVYRELCVGWKKTTASTFTKHIFS